jgi:hypothetical protein
MLLKPVNSQSSDIITHDGLSKTLRQWSIYLEIPYDTLRMRYRRGLQGDELFKQKQNYEKSGVYAIYPKSPR